MVPSGGPSTSLRGGAPPLGTLTEDKVASWSHTQVLQALYKHELMDPEVTGADTNSLRARLLANLQTQAATFNMLVRQSRSYNTDVTALCGVGLPSSGTPIVPLGHSTRGLCHL